MSFILMVASGTGVGFALGGVIGLLLAPSGIGEF